MNINKNFMFKDTINQVKRTSTSNKIIGVIFIMLILFVIIYFFWILIRDFNETQSDEPWLVSTTKIAQNPMKIPGYIIKKSNDSQYGIEFTYAFWIYINNWVYKNGEYKHVFHKGNASAMPLQAPGVWLYPRENKMAINMNTFESVKESCNIGNIPIGKWFHITIVCIGKNLDVYINGRLKKRCALKGIPKQNFGDLYINSWNGFDGFLSKFRYFNYAIPYFKIEQMINDGPSKAPCIDTGAKPPYFARDVWFTSGYPDTINN
jgi:hypothetical protein